MAPIFAGISTTGQAAHAYYSKEPLIATYGGLGSVNGRVGSMILETPQIGFTELNLRPLISEGRWSTERDGRYTMTMIPTKPPTGGSQVRACFG